MYSGPRKGIRDPNFSSVFYALRRFNKVRINGQHISIIGKPQVRRSLLKCWRLNRRGDWGAGNRTGSPLSAVGSCLLWWVEEAPGPSTGRGHRDSCSHPTEETGHSSHQTIKRKQVCFDVDASGRTRRHRQRLYFRSLNDDYVYFVNITPKICSDEWCWD